MLSRKLVTAGVIIGGLAAALVMFIAWQYSPQCEFDCEGNVDWRNLLMLGGVSFLQVFVFVVCLVLFIRAIKRL
ncbi:MULTISPECIES: hypothetical protein [Corallincola]|uniref:Uncharacterized protein n=2 Tax=Corallincola TaxID=1775176 RepID=A0A368NPS0_9GAMM|nr:MULTISPECIES: hypothetical protein [Corallincola]RCU52542.1 hypothetical protein DU002_00805 [Corallincola holothuriorum]TAA48265.1 hypothetical protein EXY25_03260 [Corallincola spongiicola]